MMRMLVTLGLAGLVLGGCGCTESTGLVGDTSIDWTTETPVPDAPWPDVPVTDVIGPDGRDAVDIPGTETPSTDASWDPAIEGMGDPGWRDSIEPYCRDEESFFMELDIWSDHRGVFVVVGGMEPIPEFGGTLIFNGGSGWSELLSVDPMFPEEGGFMWVKGIPGGPVFLWGWMGTMTTYDLGSGTSTVDWVNLTDVHAVSSSLAYATTGEGPRLLKWEDGSWGPFPGDPVPYSTNKVWADETSIFCAGETGIILSWEDGSWTVHDTRTIEYITSIWGFSSRDVWAGTDRGTLLHYDGADWEHVTWPDMGDGSDCRPTRDGIMGMWGVDGVLFFHTSRQLVMWDGAGFRTLGYWAGTYSGGYCRGEVLIRGIWGNSASELFLVVHESEIDTALCEEYILWWDGSAFHWF